MNGKLAWLAAGAAYLLTPWLVDGKLFGLLFTSLWDKLIDYDTDTIKVMLTTSAYVPNQDTHDFKNDVTNEVSGTGYTAGGEALTGKTVTYTAGTNVHKLDANNSQWTASSITARIAVVYDSSPATDATRPLIGYQDFITDRVSDNGLFEIQWDAAGIVEITVS